VNVVYIPAHENHENVRGWVVNKVFNHGGRLNDDSALQQKNFTPKGIPGEGEIALIIAFIDIPVSGV
jgi:hypothetical protein